MANAYRDQNSVPTLLAVSNADGETPVRLHADPTTHRLLTQASGGLTGLETPTGTVDGSNTSFTVSNTPVVLFVDGMVRLQGFDFTYSGGTITMNIAPSIYIRSLY